MSTNETNRLQRNSINSRLMEKSLVKKRLAIVVVVAAVSRTIFATFREFGLYFDVTSQTELAARNLVLNLSASIEYCVLLIAMALWAYRTSNVLSGGLMLAASLPPLASAGVLALWGIAQNGSGSAAQYVAGNGSWVIYACACLVFIASVVLIFVLRSQNELERRRRMLTASHQEKPGGGPKHYTPY